MSNAASEIPLLDGQFEVQRELGRGGMGRVLLVRDRSDAQAMPRAAKLLETPALHSRFMAEVTLLRRLCHPSFVAAHQTGYDSAQAVPYLLLEACLGPTLDNPDPHQRDLVEVIAGLLRALDHLHRLGYAHGDIAPSNLLWEATGDKGTCVKILDLGASGPIGSGEGSTSGVLQFVAPERLAGAALSERADLWSLGAVIYLLDNGTHPFPDYPGRPAKGTPAGKDNAVTPVLQRMLAPNPADRYPSAAAALSALASATHRDLPLVTPAELTLRLQVPPFIDRAGQIRSLLGETAQAAVAGRPSTACIYGPDGSGRSRAVRAIGDGLVDAGANLVVESARPGDADGAVLQRIFTRLGTQPGRGERRAAAAVQELLSIARAPNRPNVAIIIDDFEHIDELSATVLAGVARSAAAIPERTGPLFLLLTSETIPETVQGVLGADLELRPWDADDVELLLSELFPGRRVGSRVTAPLVAESGGVPGVVCAVTAALANEGALSVDAAAVHLDSTVLPTLRLPTSMAQAAALALDALTPKGRRLAACLASASTPLPMNADRELAELIDNGVAVGHRSGEGLTTVTLRSPALARQALAQFEPAEIHAELARLWGAQPSAAAKVLAISHQLRAGQDEAVPHADALLTPDAPESTVRALLPPLTSRGWPKSPRRMLEAATLASRAGDCDTAEALFRRAAADADAEIATLAWTRLGALQARQARHQQATEALTRALELGAGNGNRAELLDALSRSAVLSGSAEEAESWAAEGFGLARDEGVRGRLAYTRGLAAWYRGDLDEAESLFRIAKEAAVAANDNVELGAIVTAQGLVAHRRGDLAKAHSAYTEALSIGEHVGDDARVLTALQNLGVVHHERREWMKALDTYREAMELAEALEQPGRVVQLTGNIGNLWRYLGELSRARTALQRGLVLARRHDNAHMVAVNETMLGEVYLAEEQWSEAEQHLTTAVQQSRLAQASNEEVEALLSLSRLHLERQEFDSATLAARQALEVCDRVEAKALKSQALALLGASELRRLDGDAEAGQQFIRDAVATMSSITNPDNQWPILIEAAWAAARVGDADRSGALATKATALLRSLEDGVPAEHRDAFRSLRERRRATLDARVLAWGSTSASQEVTAVTQSHAGGGWERLLEINKRLNTEYDVKRLLEYIMDSAILLTGAERGFLLLDNGKGDDELLSIEVARNIDQENIRNVRLKISHGIARRVIATGEPALTIDAMEDDRYAEQLSVHDLKLRSVLCLPMRVAGRVLGAIYLDNRFQRSAFGDAELRFMEAFGDQAAIALGNARLVETMAKQREALTRAKADNEALNEQLAGQLKAQAAELENTHKVVIRQQRQLELKHTYDAIIGSSQPLRRVFAIMDRLLDNAIPVLIEGESGTGKELVARAIHYNGTRKDRPFVAVNCGAIPANLLESELFGHVRGAFTGASSDKQGLFQAADHGTLLLDELGELPLEMQVKLLRVLQNGEIKRVGATRDITVDVRIIAATNRKLEEEVAAGRFREDLYYRLSVVPMQLPPLRDRPDDIPLLVNHFIRQNQESGLSGVSGIAPAAMTLLRRYQWPGNVRQLEMVLKNASLFADGETLQPRDFDAFPDITTATASAVSSGSLAGRSLADIEREAIIAALQHNRGNKKRSAEQLGIDRRTLYNKLKAYKIMIQKELTVQ